MGLWEAAQAFVGIEIKAKADQAIAETRRFAGEQKKAMGEIADGLKSNAAAHEAMVTRVTAAIGVAVAAYAVARTSLKAYEEQTRLVGATAGINLQALKRASGGLKTEMELLQLAADGVNGKFNLTQAEIEKVLVGMRALTKEGKDQAIVAKVVGDAVRKGEIEPLKEAGIVYDEAIAKVDKKRALLDAMGQAATRAGGKLGMASDETKRMGVAFEDSTNRIRAAIGQVVTAATPAIESFAQMAVGLARIASGIAAIVDKASHLPGGGIVGTVAKNAWRVLPQGQLVTAATAGYDWLVPGGGNESIDQAAAAGAASRYEGYGDYGYEYIDPQVQRDAIFAIQTAQDRLDARIRSGMRKARRMRARAGAGPRRPAPGTGLLNYGREVLGSLGEQLTFDENGQITDVGGALEGFGQLEFGSTPREQLLAEMRQGLKQLQSLDVDKIMKENKLAARESVLEKIFGPAEQFNVYAAGFGTVKNAAQAAFQAWIDGSMSAGKAFKQSIAQQLGAQAVEALGVGITSGVWGVYHLATGNPKGAGELAASGKAFAAAGVLGGLARSLGAGSTPSVGASAAGVGPRGGGGGGGEGKTVNLYFGDSMGWETQRTQAIKFRQLERLAQNRLPAPAGVGD